MHDALSTAINDLENIGKPQVSVVAQGIGVHWTGRVAAMLDYKKNLCRLFLDARRWSDVLHALQQHIHGLLAEHPGMDDLLDGARGVATLKVSPATEEFEPVDTVVDSRGLHGSEILHYLDDDARACEGKLISDVLYRRPQLRGALLKAEAVYAPVQFDAYSGATAPQKINARTCRGPEYDAVLRAAISARMLNRMIRAIQEDGEERYGNARTTL